MSNGLLHKFTQNNNFRDALLQTGDALIAEHINFDKNLGDGAWDGKAVVNRAIIF
jgi:predicted NAD-dependent protein-ADP-ribosyltransferase YbiA (DUF1768 family)